MSSASTLYRLLQYWFMSILCFVIRHDVIINESLKPHYFFDDHMRTWKTAKEGHLKADTFWKVHFKMWRILKKLIWFLTHCSMLTSKSEALSFFNFKIWRVGISHFKISHVTKIFISEWCFLKSTNFEKHVVFTEQKNQNVILWMQKFFQYLTFWKTFQSESNAAYFFQSQIWRVVKFLYQYVTC